MSSNYNATVVKLNHIRKHSNADKLACTNIFGNNIIVGLDAKEGDIGLFFPLESRIGKEFAEANDLIRRKDENGKRAGGMFDENRRVRCKTLRGEKSMGFYCPISYLHSLFPGINVVVGQELNEINGVVISEKYVVQSKKYQGESKRVGKVTKESRVVSGQFHFHFDTAQLGKNLHKIQPNDIVSVTWKTHGTSGVCANILVKKELTWYEKLLKKIGVNVVDEEYDYVFSSRKVIKNDYKECNHFYDTDIWSEVGEKFKGSLHKGETLYYEILGYLPYGQYIQKDYDYGCAVGDNKVQVYRITQTNADGVVTELPWHQVVHRCNEIGVDTVPEIFYGKVSELVGYGGDNSLQEWQENLLIKLQQDYVYDQDCQFCINKVPAEGIVVRVERGDGIENFKLKSFRFYEYESVQLDSGEVDTESGENNSE